MTVTGATSGATGTIIAISGTTVIVRHANNALFSFLPNELISPTSAQITTGSIYENEDGEIYRYNSGGSYQVESKWSTGSNYQTNYFFLYYILDKDLPKAHRGSEFDAMMYVTVIESYGQTLLDAAPQLCRHRYSEGNGSLGNNTNTIIPSTQRMNAGNGFGFDTVFAYLSASWLAGGSIVAHGFYSVGELTRFWRNIRAYQLAARINNSGVSKTTLAGMSKGWTIANVTNRPIQQWNIPESGSTARQFETQRQIYIANPGYVNPYSVREGMPERPVYLLAGSNIDDNIGAWDNATSNPTGANNVIRQEEIPELPTTIYNILVDIGEIIP
jgi:hypothetical protein